ncbi:MAG: hypothetical protein LQ346_006180 [Caloplaca aetnensis]|nr:MAG: hypothetical protein LQ346_006180 [Caloplaca aetnensis]
MCLLAVRSRESRQHAPDLKLDGRRVARVLAQSAEVTLHAGCCLALLKGLRPVGEFSVPKQQPAFAVLQEHHRDFHLSIEAWIQFIFQPTADHLANLEEETDIAILDDFDDNLLNRLQTRIRELEGRLNDAYRQNGWDDVQPLDPTAMPARAPWELMMACVALENHFGGKDSSNAGNRVSGAYFGYQDSTDRLEASMTDKGDMLSHLKTFISDHSSEWSVSDGESPRGATELYGGFPRMTFCTLDETQKEPSIVLGFTAASWSPNSKPLRDWATESRKESLKRYKGCQILGRRKRAVDTLRQSERQHGGWSQTHMIEAVRDFRDTEQLKPFGQASIV